MAKHRRISKTATRRAATASAVVMGATLLAPGAANAVEVAVPNTDIRFNVQGLDAVPGIQSNPVAQQFIPNLQAEVNNFTSNVPNPIAASSSNSTGEAIVAAARSKIGAPYSWGAVGPNAFDCSGLTSWAYQQVGKSIPRTSQAQASAGQQVSLDSLQPGDVIAYYGGASHVGIYAGNGMIIDALGSGTPVAERPLNYMPIHSAVRF
ncbi:putative endopeptidase precursor [Corynebacterium atrinae]|uniref:NlpC/P60 family protein n=1 Tax=Corynebacterium atrinae TaxID=1336740 RepID=UPI0025B5BB0A|nr:NlpC/P60 family protein [Corynebacterium atrinae]WJY63838.1 putative endopeptidase precursor [Corynebacterium atrinae]